MGGQGLWPAFWLYEYNNSGGGGDEIDIFETKQECPYYIHTDLHPYGSFQVPWNSSNVGGWHLLNGPTTGSFNTYRAVWEPGGFVQFSINRSVIESTWPINYISRMTLIANVAVGTFTNQVSAGCPTVGFEHAPNNTTVFPSSMDIEYIRIWKPLYCTQNVVLCNYPTGLIDDESITGNTVQIGNFNCVNNIVTYYNGMQLDIAAISEINFVGETSIDGAMYARIVSCPNPPQNRSNESGLSGFIDSEEYNEEIGLAITNENNLNVTNDPLNSNYEVSPNPSLSVFAIQFYNTIIELPRDINAINVFNLIGESVLFNYSFEQGKLNIDLSNQKAGVYLLKIQVNQTFYQIKLNKL